MGSKLSSRHGRHDHYYKQAKDSSFAARSIFKLEEIDKRIRLLRSGQKILDLGCRPGSWLQYAAQRVGPAGLVIGVDRTELDIALPDNARAIAGNVFELTAEQLRTYAPCYQVVLSDMAPDTCGIAFTDQTRSYDLFMRAFELARAVGCPQSALVGKIFMGHSFDDALKKVRAHYGRVKVIRPEATRSISSEVFIAAQDLKRL